VEAGMATLSEVLVFLIEQGPGRTETELADAIGDRALEHEISAECRRLVDQGKVRRRGTGSLFDPFTYYPV
jgi:glycosyltransferase A (GT-A) superfamily protein (DUF2064 family)